MKDFFKYVFASITGYIILIVLFGFIGIAFIFSMALSSDKSVVVKNDSILKLSLSGEIVERKKEDPFSEIPFFNDDRMQVQGLNDILAMIDKASQDPNIAGIYIQSGGFRAGFSTCDEIRSALENFKQSGKFIYAYGAMYTQKGYYISSVADSIFLNPQGGVDLRGLASQQTFFKNALEKLDVEVNIIKHGKYKSAVEPFFRENNSPENEQQLQVLLDGLWGQFVDKVSASRGISKQQLNEYASQAMLFKKQELNLQYKLVDGLTYYDQIEASLLQLQGKGAKDEVEFVDLFQYKKADLPDEKRKSTRDKIAVIYASGGIDMGGSDGIQSGKLAETIRKVRKDERVKAVVLRVNSPGGSAYGSEQIWREVQLLADKVPLVVSMGDVAASGGYYIACAADTIVANKSTITGSIGIYGSFMTFGKTFEKLGVTFDRVKTHELSDIMSGTRSMLPDEKAMLQAWIERGYDTFVNRCAEGRGVDYAFIDKVGQGRVWTGEDAKNEGLVDVFGGMDKAMEIAAEMAGLEEYRTQYLPKQKTFMERLMEDFQLEAKNMVFKMRFGDEFEIYEKFLMLKDQQGMQARMPFDLEVY